MVATTGLKRSTKPHIRGTPRRSAQATSARLVSRSGVTGFSTRIGLPSSSSARAALAWKAVGVAITAASQPVAASRSSAKAQPEPLGERSHPLGVGVDDDREVGAFGLRDDARVVGPHRPGSDQRNPGTSTHGRSLSRADLPDRKFAGPFR